MKKANLVSLAVNAHLIRVQYIGYAAKHLKNKGLTIHEIKLFDRVFDSSRYEFVRLMRRV